ncbi:MAG: response regulator transcription factor [Acidobacteriota bacterium]|nr:response regulator transcription factor [Acidobacteriota bacterium]
MADLILLIDDDSALAAAVEHMLAKAGYGVLLAESAGAARAIIADSEPGLIILDLILPDEDGLDFCREIRAQSEVPIVIMSCRTDHADRVVGLEAGADDYVTKPFSLSELACRICAVLRRAGGSSGAEEEDGGRPLDDPQPQPLPDVVELVDRRIALTEAERRVLGELARRPGEVVSPAELVSALGNRRSRHTRTAASHVASIRRKLAEAGVRDVIKTVRGFGYRLG